ncbi:beta-glucosidase [Acidicapsa ligni]|uniref:beta-glucosidase n=1 Tax=Acidicapsa ligni TaxID=542300 RepID=UPI0021E040EA|nr:glycoside hydrolase family 3 C-terminal domain-containing protein [Acidicapsa ligni]
MKISLPWRQSLTALAILTSISVASPAQSPRHKPAEPAWAHAAWMNKSLSPDERADLVMKQLTLDQKIDLLHGQGMPGWGKAKANAYLGNGGAGFVLGIPELGIPFIQMSDAAYGVRSSAMNGRYSTALPSNLGAAASWDTESACEYGALIGRELRAQGYNMTLGGGVNITREPRNGRTFEYQGEDPILAGTLVGNRIKCEQAQHVIGDIKHFAVNDQESGRNEVDSIIDKRSLRETDLLAFEIGISVGDPAAVMCSYNAINGDYACENHYTLTDVLRNDWHFKGFVLSDWGGTHSVLKASKAGLDNEQPEENFYGDTYKKAVQDGKISEAELNEHVHRILRSEFAAGLVDDPIRKSVVDVEAGFETAQRIEEHSIVLLKNSSNLLPLDKDSIKSIAIIGDHADMGMISGGGSAQVDPPGGYNPVWLSHVWFPTSPLKSIIAKAPTAKVLFDSGADTASAAALAKQSDVAIVFVNQWTSEGEDLKSLSLPNNQDALISAVAAANPKTVVVLETGTAVTMPWLDQVGAVTEAWYSGSKGAQAVANVLFGDVNPSAKLPMTFPRSEADLPHPTVVQPPPGAQGPSPVMHNEDAKATFSVTYSEGLKVGYKWYDAEKKPVLFPFGFGLSYTTFTYSDLQVTPGSSTSVSFKITNSGSRAGTEIAEVYAALPAVTNEPPKRLVGWSKVKLAPGESKTVSVAIDPKYLSVFDVAADQWKLTPGGYTFMVGGSSQDLPLTKAISIN